MRIIGAVVGASALLVLGSLPRSAEAQCAVAYGDFNVNTAQGTIEAWSFTEDYFSSFCSPGGFGDTSSINIR